MVVDCSAVIDALVSQEADELRELLASNRLTAPDLLDFELTSVVRGLVLGQRVSPWRGDDLLDDYEKLAITRWSYADDVRHRSLELRHNFSAHDASYVVLAESLEVTLVTRDRRLAKAAGGVVQVIVR